MAEEAPRIIFDAAQPQQRTLNEFLAAYSPSRVSQYQASWICVQGISYLESTSNKYVDAGDVDGLQRAWNLLLSNTNDRQPDAELVREIALAHRVLSGKWMLFIPRSRIDEVWNRIAAATANGHLGCGAKVSPREPASDGDTGKREPSHLICVYVEDFADEANVTRVRECLRLMGFTRKLSFKADAYTYLNIYSGNEWGIPPSIYYS